MREKGTINSSYSMMNWNLIKDTFQPFHSVQLCLFISLVELLVQFTLIQCSHDLSGLSGLLGNEYKLNEYLMMYFNC